MLRPPESPWASSGCSLPKNSLLSLMSSMYLVLVPYLASKLLIVFLSM